MDTTAVTVHETVSNRPIRPLHGVGGGPKTYNFWFDASKWFESARIPYVRLHDIEYPLGGGHFVDIHCIFPDFSADPNDPESYDFYYTDRYLKAIKAAGSRIFYRLGESIDWSAYRRYVRPPADYAKWASICEHIVRHYNDGWANGFHFDISYWEIWNEPEGEAMWEGTKEEFFELYRVTANHLKEKHPKIKIGGYGGCGFYRVTRGDEMPDYRKYMQWVRDFLRFCKAPETATSLDFLSWHLYSDSPEEVLEHAVYARKLLDESGFTETESILDEWNYWSAEGMFEKMRSPVGASFAAKTLCLLQSSPDGPDLATYYDAQPRQSYGGIFMRVHTGSEHVVPSKTYYAFQAFSELYVLGKEVASSGSGRITCCAAGNGKSRAILMVNYENGPVYVRLNFEGAPGKIKLYILDGTHDLTLMNETFSNESSIVMGQNSLALAYCESLAREQ